MKIIKNLFRIGLIAAAVALVAIYAINSFVVDVSSAKVMTREEATTKNADCIIVLGCGVRADGTPSHMLEDRLNEGIALYKAGAAPKILMSGDHGQKNYDEVNLMKSYAVKKGVPSEDVFMDHAGFSTYESMYRAKEIFEVKSAVVVTQKFHIYRALYIADSFGIESVGVNSDPRAYRGSKYNELREMLAISKDFVKCIFKPEPTYLGETIPVSGNGDATND